MNLKGYVIRDGRVVRKKSRKSVTQRIAEKRLTKQRAVSKSHADLIHFTFGNGNGAKGSKGT